MKNISTDLFLYIALIFIFYPLFISLFRKVKLQEFLAHIGIGIILGLTFSGLYNFSILSKEQIISENPILKFLTFSGLFLFLMNLGYNFNFNVFKTIDKKTVQNTIIIFLLISIFLGLGTFFFVFKGEFLTTILFVSALISVNVGPVVSIFFSKRHDLKKSLAQQVQTAVLLDIITIWTFSIFHTALQNSRQKALWEDLIFLLVFIIITLLVFYPPSTKKISKSLKKLPQEYSIVLQLGIFCIVLYTGFNTNISILFLGIWAGIILKLFKDEEEIDFKNRFFSVASLLYPLPFIDVGWIAVFEWNHTIWFWLYLNLILDVFIFVFLIFSLYLRIVGEEFKLNSLSIFARGELNILILWLIYQTNILSVQVFIAAVAAVIVTYIFTKLILTKWAKKSLKDSSALGGTINLDFS